MCQKAEGESNYLIARDRDIRRRGYEAFKASVRFVDCPESDHPNPEYSDKRQWQYGWTTAAEGRELW